MENKWFYERVEKNISWIKYTIYQFKKLKTYSPARLREGPKTNLFSIDPPRPCNRWYIFIDGTINSLSPWRKVTRVSRVWYSLSSPSLPLKFSIIVLGSSSFLFVGLAPNRIYTPRDAYYSTNGFKSHVAPLLRYPKLIASYRLVMGFNRISRERASCMNERTFCYFVRTNYSKLAYVVTLQIY